MTAVRRISIPPQFLSKISLPSPFVLRRGKLSRYPVSWQFTLPPPLKELWRDKQKGWIFRRTDFTIPIWFQNYSKIIWDTLKSTTWLFLNTTPSDTSRRLWASIPPNAYDLESRPWALTTRWHGICSGSGLLWRIFPTTRAKFRFPRCKAICP